MAYPVVSAPYGLKPINLIGGQVFAGSTREIPIQYGEATTIYYGDFVKVAQGFAQRLAVSTGGGASGAKQPILEPTKRIQNAGSETSPVIEQHVWNYRVPEDQAEEANEATAANIETEQTSGPGVVGAGTGLTAELKIIGDPFYTNGVNFVAKFVSIVFISPFYIGNSKDVKRTGPTWLQTSNCNSILSNKKYLIQGISHNISNGTFTTTLSLKLLAPNLDIPYLSDLGGNGCGSLDGNFEDADAPTVE